MSHNMSVNIFKWPLLFILSHFLSLSQSLEFNQIKFENIDHCEYNDTYNSVSLSCVPCGAGTVVSNATGKCICLPGWRIKQSGSTITCNQCQEGHEATFDGRSCIRCHTGGCGPCPDGQIRVERNIDGAALAR